MYKLCLNSSFFFVLFLFCKNININHLEIKELQYVNGRTVGDN